MPMYSKTQLPTKETAIIGRDKEHVFENRHFLNNVPLKPPFGENMEIAYFGLGCFWGAERRFWQQKGVYSTAVGYGAGFTKNPTYEEVCTGGTGHNELVMVVFDKTKTSYEALLKVFFESHDPTQGMRQGGDIGTQYRSGIYPNNQSQLEAAKKALASYRTELKLAGYGEITTEIIEGIDFYYAEDYHQQYLAKNPNGYCGIGGLGVSCPIGLNV